MCPVTCLGLTLLRHENAFISHKNTKYVSLFRVFSHPTPGIALNSPCFFHPFYQHFDFICREIRLSFDFYSLKFHFQKKVKTISTVSMKIYCLSHYTLLCGQLPHPCTGDRWTMTSALAAEWNSNPCS